MLLGCPDDTVSPPAATSGSTGSSTSGTSTGAGTTGTAGSSGSTSDTAATTSSGTSGATSEGSATLAMDGSSTAGTQSESESGGSGSTGAPSGNCGTFSCSGHSACVVTDAGPACVCDEGYIPSPDDPELCIVDTHCVVLRGLGHATCRFVADGPPAVGLFFAADYCSGTAVLPEDLAALTGADPEDLASAFVVRENDRDVAENPESYATILEKDVESYVTLVLDVSASVTQSEDLPALIQSIRQDLLAPLEPGPGEAPVYFTLFVFGDGAVRLVDATTDLGRVDAALAELQANPNGVYSLALGPNGTDLFRATKFGVEETERLRDLRHIVSKGGVLTTGTVVVVTDGRDESNLDPSIIPQTSTSVVSIGVSYAIRDEELQLIGTSGSILAPEVSDWQSAFQEIGARVDEYPERTYLLGYCSSANSGEAVVSVSVAAQTLTFSGSVSCNFNADNFSPLALSCDASYFADECEASDCGGISACGACADDECCAAGQCIAPTTFEPCSDDDGYCRADGEICVEVEAEPEGASGSTGEVPDDAEHRCEAPAALDAPCDPGCAPGTGYCLIDPEDPEDEGVCVPVFAFHDPCEVAEQCPTLHCQSLKPENPLQPTRCLAAAEVYDVCEGDIAVCEAGSYCASVCTRKLDPLEACSDGSQCASGYCAELGSGSKVCLETEACFFTWSEKLGAP